MSRHADRTGGGARFKPDHYMRGKKQWRDKKEELRQQEEDALEQEYREEVEE
jgi:hypothetical protein